VRVLVLGGYGNFGARIARALAGDAGIELCIGGRDARRAEEMAERLGGGAQGWAVDASRAGFEQGLRERGIGLVVHTAGPFQASSRGCASGA
jgi:short subunit dehydrogenase-like uncharacterized protein